MKNVRLQNRILLPLMVILIFAQSPVYLREVKMPVFLREYNAFDFAFEDKVCGYQILQGFGAARLINGGEEARIIFQKVAQKVGLTSSSVRVSASSEVRSRIAVACENKIGDNAIIRYVLYDPTIMNDLAEDIESDWFQTAIFAHEAGHIVKNHNILALRQVPCADILNADDENGKTPADMELESDEIAGEVLAKLGATLSESQAVFNRISTDDPNDGCYPSRLERLGAVKRGWDKFAKQIKGSDAYERGSKALDDKNWDLAIIEFTRAIMENPDYVEAYNRRGVAFHRKNNREEALADYNKAIRIKPDFPLPYFNRALIYGTTDIDRAITDLTTVIKLDPTATRSYIERGRYYFVKKMYDQALADYTVIIERKRDLTELEPKDSKAFSNRGLVYIKKMDYERAITDLSNAIKLNPIDADAYFNRAIAYKALGKNTEAAADTEMVKKINSQD